MVVPTGFSSWSSYFGFAFAKSFVDKEQNPYRYEPNRWEKVGHAMSRPFAVPLHWIARQYNNPLVIAALTITGLAIATLLFYPAHALAALPFLLYLKPWMIKVAAYTLLQITILGLGIRAIGRLKNPALLESWQKSEIEAVHLGMFRMK